MGAATHYDYYGVTLRGNTIASIGSADGTGVAVTDQPSGGGNTAILGNVPRDPFQVNGVPGMVFAGTVTWDAGAGEGFIARQDGHDYLFVVHGAPPPPAGTAGDFTRPPGAGESGEWNLLTHTIACFYQGTMIATPDGERPVESLQAGDLVLTAAGAAKPVIWLGRSTVSRPFADPVRALPVRIMSGALAEHVPVRDLLVSHGHAILIDGVLAQAGTLVTGETIVRETDVPMLFHYYHVELATHDILLADGARAESFLEGAEDMQFHNWADRPRAAGPAEELRYPRAKSPRQLPRALRARLAARAAIVAPRPAAA